MQTLIEFLRKYYFFFLFLLLEIISLVLIGSNTYYQKSIMMRWANSIAGRWYSSLSSISGYFNLRHENEILLRENARLRAHMASSFISYDTSIFQYNDTVYRQHYDYRSAQVIKNSWGKRSNYLMLNKGEDQGIRTGMAVSSPQGMVGIVMQTTRNFSVVMPVLHADSRNSVTIKRTKTNGTLVWRGGDYRYATVIDIPITHKLYKNDTVITSGLADDFPEGVLVGFVEALYSVKGSGFYDVKIRLATDFNRLNNVYVIDNRFRQEQQQLEELVLQQSQDSSAAY